MEQNEAWKLLKEMTRDLAPILWAYYGELERLGFSEEQAFKITLDYHNSLLNGTKRG